MHILSLIAAGHALLTKRDPRSALGWTVALIFLPIIGLIVYLIFGISRAQSRAERIMRQLTVIDSRFPHETEDSCAFFPRHSEQDVLERLSHRLTSLPLLCGNSIRPLHDGDEAYPEMLAAIAAARKHVFLSTYIFSAGEAADKFIAALCQARQRGVDVRVLVDGIGQLYSWHKPWKILKERGVPTELFRPLRLFPPNFGINLRNHRKVLVCDEIGFTGGMNIADGDVLRLPGKPTKKIQDMQFKFHGPVVAQLRQAFLLNWSFVTGIFSPLPPMPEPDCGSSKCRVIVDGPSRDADLLNDLLCGAINLARREIWIMTPYFLPTLDLTASLRSAALRGVDVRVVLPKVNNLAYMAWAMHRIMPTLLKAGVRIWHQPPPFAHTKLFTMDGFYSLIGSANLDSRSLRLNFELEMEIFDPDLAANLSKFIDSKITAGQEITLSQLNALTLPVKLRDAVAWLFSPYF